MKKIRKIKEIMSKNQKMKTEYCEKNSIKLTKSINYKMKIWII